MRDFDNEIQEHLNAISEIRKEKEESQQKTVLRIKEMLNGLTSTQLLDLIEEETTARRRNRDEIQGSNDININKINKILKDEFWCTKIYILLEDGEYRGFVQEEKDAILFKSKNSNSKYKEEIIDLRQIY